VPEGEKKTIGGVGKTQERNRNELMHHMTRHLPVIRGSLSKREGDSGKFQQNMGTLMRGSVDLKGKDLKRLGKGER